MSLRFSGRFFDGAAKVLSRGLGCCRNSDFTRKCVISVNVKLNTKQIGGADKRVWFGLSHIFLLFVVLGLSNLSYARTSVLQPTHTELPTVLLAELPKEAGQTYILIQSGGPFPYAKDGTVFFNRERILPPKARGSYQEYTVPTPGINHRGARRLVCEVSVQLVRHPCYYTADHYRSFRQVLP